MAMIFCFCFLFAIKMVKTYLRYEEEGSFGVISSREGEVQLTKDGHFVLSSALEHVQLWNIKTAEMVKRIQRKFCSPSQIRVFRGETSPSTCVCLSPDEKLLAIGYQDGYIRIFEFATGWWDTMLFLIGIMLWFNHFLDGLACFSSSS